MTHNQNTSPNEAIKQSCQSTHPTNFSFTENAAEKIHELVVDHPTPLALQIYITGGGCHGFKYNFKLAEGSKPDDIIISRSLSQDPETTICVLIDRISHKYLNQATLDFRISATGEEFVIKNPQKTTCGCGQSFA
ncbi:MAG: HesB/IscA family protein [Candidatus Comchoanobacterales bacterium]